MRVVWIWDCIYHLQLEFQARNPLRAKKVLNLLGQLLSGEIWKVRKSLELLQSSWRPHLSRKKIKKKEEWRAQKANFQASKVKLTTTLYQSCLKGFTCMHWTLPPLLAMEVMSLLAFLVTGKAEVDLRPLNGATMLAWAGERLTVVTAADEIIEEAITCKLIS